MPSIYQQALGTEFGKLHPQLQKKFGLKSADRKAAVSHGIMEEMTGGSFLMKPFLKLGTLRNITFSERGTHIPFTLENYAYEDSFGRETMAWIRSFHFDKRIRSFDATMVYSPEKGCVVDYLGNVQELTADLELTVTENGGLRLCSEGQRWQRWGLSLSLPSMISARADVSEWYVDDEEKFHISVKVTYPMIGEIFGYRGTFEINWIDIEPEQIPEYAKPKFEQKKA